MRATPEPSVVDELPESEPPPAVTDHETMVPLSGAPPAALTCTASCTGKEEPTAADWPLPLAMRIDAAPVASTFTELVADSGPDEAVMVAWPNDTAVTVPAASTEATAGLEDIHWVPEAVAVLPNRSRADNESRRRPPTPNEDDAGATVRSAAVAG